MQAASQMSYAAQLEQASKSAVGTAVTAVRNTITNLNESEDYSVGPLDSQRNTYAVHDAADLPPGSQIAQLHHDSSVRGPFAPSGRAVA